MLFSKIIIPGGSLFSLGVIIFNGVVAGMVSLLIFIALEIASISLSVSVFKKYKKLNGEMMGMENTEYMSEVRNSYFGNTDSKASVPRYIPNN